MKERPMRRGERVKLWEEQKTLDESLLSILCKNWGVPGQMMSSGDWAAMLWANSLGLNYLLMPVIKLDYQYFVKIFPVIPSNHNKVVTQRFKASTIFPI